MGASSLVSGAGHRVDRVGDRLGLRRSRGGVARRGAASRQVPASRGGARCRGRGSSTGLHGPAPTPTLWKIGSYFAEAGAFVFGSGLAIVPFLHGGVVNEFHWLTERQFLDAVAVAMITPGPVVITVAFIGYLVGGPAGRDARRHRRLPALLPLRHHPGAVLPALRQSSAGEGLRRRRDRRGDRRDRRGRLRARPARDRRRADGRDRDRDVVWC